MGEGVSWVGQVWELCSLSVALTFVVLEEEPHRMLKLLCLEDGLVTHCDREELIDAGKGKMFLWRRVA